MCGFVFVFAFVYFALPARGGESFGKSGITWGLHVFVILHLQIHVCGSVFVYLSLAARGGESFGKSRITRGLRKEENSDQLYNNLQMRAFAQHPSLHRSILNPLLYVLRTIFAIALYIKNKKTIKTTTKISTASNSIKSIQQPANESICSTPVLAYMDPGSLIVICNFDINIKCKYQYQNYLTTSKWPSSSCVG